MTVGYMYAKHAHDTLKQVGIEFPEAITAVVDAHDAALKASTTATERLAAAVSAGDAQAAHEAAIAVAAAKAGANVEIDSTAGAAAHTRIMEIMTDSMVWSQVAERFNEAANRFHEAMKNIEPDANPADAARASVRVGTMWADYPEMVQALELRFEELIGASHLYGMSHAASMDEAENALGLIADLTGVHPRRATEAWDKRRTGRGGRWAELVHAGARLRAIPSFDDFKPVVLPAMYGDIDPLDGPEAVKAIEADLKRRGIDEQYIVKTAG